MPVDSALPIARSFAQFLNLANVAEQYHRVRRRRAYQRDPRARPQPASIEEALPRLLSSGDRGRHAASRRLRPRHRAGDDGAPDRDHAALAAAQVHAASPSALATLDHSDVTCLERENAVDDDAARDHGGVGDRRGTPRAAVAARRGALGAGGLRGDAVGRAAAVLPLARSHAEAGDRARPADRRRADPVRLVDRRRSRRQSVRDAGSDAARLPDGALDGAVALREGSRAAALRPLDVGGVRRAALSRRRRARTVSRPAAGAAAADRVGQAARRGPAPARRQTSARKAATAASRGSPRSSRRRPRSPNRCTSATARCRRPATASSPRAG